MGVCSHVALVNMDKQDMEQLKMNWFLEKYVYEFKFCIWFKPLEYE